MSNPFLSRVKYTPEEVPAPIAPASTAGDVPSADRRPAPRARSFRTLLMLLFAVVLGAFADEAVRALSASAASPPIALDSYLDGTEVERYSSLDAALEATTPALRPLVAAWNAAGSRRVDLPLGEDSSAVLVLRPRPGYERAFEQLLRAGALERISLYSVRIPPSWTAAELSARQARWSSYCGVTRPAIDRWSGFRPAQGAERRNECRPGGRCIIASPACSNAILTDVQNGSAL